MRKASGPLHIHLQMELNWHFSRCILEGIVEARAAHPWNWMFTSQGAGTVMRDAVPALPVIQGAIGSWSPTWGHAGPWDTRKLPFVHTGDLEPRGLPAHTWMVTADNHAVGCMAGEYFLDRGFRSLAFVEYHRKYSSGLRRQGFADAVGHLGTLHELLLFEKGAPELKDFLRGLPLGTGIFCANDAVARAVCTQLYLLGRKVPEELAVLGVDDDSVQSSLSPVPLSSVDIRPREIGRRAAGILHAVLEGETPPRCTFIEPAGIIERRSSDLLAITDPKMAAVLRRIRERACEGIRVADLLLPKDGARRSLEQKFQALLGRSIEDEIRRCRLDSARQMLLSTSLGVENVADRCGFVSLAHFSRLFKKHYGLSPSQFRKARGS